MVIGSAAIKYFYPDFPRDFKDIDIIKGSKFNDYYSIELRREYLQNPILLENCKDYDFLSPDEIYTLKISHTVGWKLENNSWDKHIWDIQWLKEKRCVLIPDLFKKLYDYWNIIHGPNKRSNLDMDANSFFDNAIKYPISHDLLHEMLIKHPYFENQAFPTYKYILKDNAEIDVSEEKWLQLSHKQKYNLVFEEVSVMAQERNFHEHYRISYHRMLNKFIRNHAPLFQAIWIIENYKECLKPAFNYKEYLKNTK
jgi:hypothetical protein